MIADLLENHSCAEGYCSRCDVWKTELRNIQDQEPMVSHFVPKEVPVTDNNQPF